MLGKYLGITLVLNILELRRFLRGLLNKHFRTIGLFTFLNTTYYVVDTAEVLEKYGLSYSS